MKIIYNILILFLIITLTIAQSTDESEEHEHECQIDHVQDYNKSLHIGSIFIILAASALGTVIPILSTHFKVLHIPRYAIIVGKCMGIGVVLASTLIHMLLPSVESLSSPCLPESFTESYEAYPYLFCLLAMIGMHFIDFCFLQYLTHREQKKRGNHLHGDENSLKDIENQITPGNEKEHCHSGHTHSSVLLDPSALKTIEAYLLEFGMTVHSIFIGLTVGVSDNDTLKALLVALSFHQFFEGVALGSRISDAKLKSHWHEVLLAFIFSVSAPLGIAIGIGVIESLNTNGSDFLLIQGVFDAVCAGILLYIGLNLLLKDFPEDMEQVCGGKKYSFLLKMGMFFGLWAGAGCMALIGKWL